MNRVNVRSQNAVDNRSVAGLYREILFQDSITDTSLACTVICIHTGNVRTHTFIKRSY